MPTLYWGLVVDSKTHQIICEEKFVAQSDDEAKIKLAVKAGVDDLDEYDLILNRLGPVAKKPKRRRKADEDADE